MVKIIPVSGSLMIQPPSNATHKIKRGKEVTVDELFNSIKNELSESPEVEGIVFHLEQPSMNPVKFAKIKRRDFGFAWPAIVQDSKPTTLMVN